MSEIMEGQIDGIDRDDCRPAAARERRGYKLTSFDQVLIASLPATEAELVEALEGEHPPGEDWPWTMTRYVHVHLFRLAAFRLVAWRNPQWVKLHEEVPAAGRDGAELDRRPPVPERLVRAIARAFDDAAGHHDPASRLISGLAQLLDASENHKPSEHADATAALVAAIERATPLMQRQSAAGTVLADAAPRAAVSLAVTLSQPGAEVRALAAVGLVDEWRDVVGLAKAQLEASWRADRLARRYDAHQGSRAVDASGPAAGVSRH